MIDEHLFRKGEGPSETLASHGHGIVPPGVDRLDELPGSR